MIILGRNYSNKEILFLLLLIVNGIIFTISLPAIFDISIAMMIHSDIFPDSQYLIIQAKSIICFITGIAYLIAAYGFHHRSSLVIAGTLGAIPFFLLYLVEIYLWGQFYPQVWIGFFLFGLLSLVIAISCYILWKK